MANAPKAPLKHVHIQFAHCYKQQGGHARAEWPENQGREGTGAVGAQFENMGKTARLVQDTQAKSVRHE